LHSFCAEIKRAVSSNIPEIVCIVFMFFFQNESGK
jgi:hypothetical protein